MFGAKANANYDGLSIPSLPPAIYKSVELVDIKKDKTTKSDGTEGTAILTFLFEGAEGMHQHTEYDIKPDAKDAAKKAENMVARLGHIMIRCGVSKAVVDANTNTTFDGLANWVLASIGQGHKGKKFDLKIVANVYNGKATSQIPGYLPFLEVVGSGKTLSFSAAEQAVIKKYNEVGNATPDAEGSGTSGGPAQGPDTDF